MYCLIDDTIPTTNLNVNQKTNQMKKLLLLSLFIFYLFLPRQTLGQVSWGTFFEKADKQFAKGKYDKALSKAKKNNKTIAKKLSNAEVYYAWIDLYEANIYALQGNFEEMDTLQSRAIKKLITSQENNPTEYLVAICKAIDIEMFTGNYLKAQTTLEALKEFAARQSLLNKEDLLAEVEVRQVRLHYYLGNLNESLHQLPKVLGIWQNLLNQSIGTFGKIGKNDKAYRQNQTADLLTLHAQNLTAQGYYASADSSLKATEKQLNRIGVDNLTQAKHQIAMGENAEDQDDYRQAQKHFEKAPSLLKKTSPAHQIVATDKLLRNYLLQEKIDDFDKTLRNRTSISQTHFRKSALYHLQEDLLIGEQKFEEEKGEEALGYFLQVWEANQKELPLTHPTRLAALEQLYYLYTELAPNPEKARVYLDSSLVIREEVYGKSSIYYLVHQVKLAKYLFRFDAFEEIKQLLGNETYQAIFKQRSDFHKEYINIANTIATYLELTDRDAEALEKVSKCTEIIRKKYGDKDIRTAVQLGKQADLELKLGRYKEAEQNANQSYQIIRKEMPRKSSERADALSLLAKVYGTMGMYREAQNYLNTSDRIYRKLGIEDFTQRGRTIDEMAFLYILTGKYAQTEALLQEDILQKEEKFGKKHHSLINSLNMMGQIFLIKGEYKQAEAHAKRAENIAGTVYGKDNSRVVGSYQLLAQYYATIGDYERAEEYLQQQINIQKKQLGETHTELAKAYTTFALVQFYRSKEKVTSSLALIAQAKSIVAQNFDEKHPLYAEVLKTQAIILLENKEYGKAFTALAEANQIWLDKLGDRNLNSAEVYLLMGDVYAYLKKFEEAKNNYLSAENIYAKVLSKNHPDYINTQSKLGRMYFVSGDTKAANKLLEQTTQAALDFIKEYFPTMSEREKTKFWAKIRPDFEFYNTLAVSQAESNPSMLESMYNFQLATKALLLNSSLKIRQSILNSKDQLLKELFVSWSNKKEELTQALALSEPQLTEEEINPIDIRNEINQLEKELSQRSDIFASGLENELYTWKDVKKSLGKQEVAVELIRFRKYENGFSEDEIYYAALIITPETNKHPELVLLKNGKELENKFLRYYRNAFQNNLQDKYSYQNYWKDIQEKVANYKTIYLSPDGVYNQINVQSFLIEEDKYVIDLAEVRLVSNTKDLLLINKKESRKAKRLQQRQNQLQEKNLVLFGNPTFYASRGEGGSIAALPGTELELQSIRQLYEGVPHWKVLFYNREMADEDTLKSIQSPTVLHIATHGFFREVRKQEADLLLFNSLKTLQNDPLRNTGLLMKGAGELLKEEDAFYDRMSGILTASEAMNLNFEDTDLVVMSACETGLGEVAIGEGVYGLQRSFLVAGADAIVMSLFKVDDEVTQELMTAFYTKWLETNDKRLAFNTAQRLIKDKYQHPSLWGAFVMMGVK